MGSGATTTWVGGHHNVSYSPETRYNAPRDSGGYTGYGEPLRRGTPGGAHTTGEILLSSSPLCSRHTRASLGSLDDQQRAEDNRRPRGSTGEPQGSSQTQAPQNACNERTTRGHPGGPVVWLSSSLVGFCAPRSGAPRRSRPRTSGEGRSRHEASGA